MKRGLWLLLLPAAGFCQGQPANTASGNHALGRLFFTPEQRDTLEYQRQRNVLKNQTLQGERLSLNGALIASGGRKTYWLNGYPLDSDDHSSGAKVIPHPRTPGQATILTGETQATELRVGEHFNRSTLEKDTGLADALLQIKPSH